MDQFNLFKKLHQQQTPLLLANAWNVRSAQLIEKAGFEAIATSSGAIASSLGYEDGEKIPFNEVLYIVQRIKACTGIPLTVDIEKGYTNDLALLNDHIQKLIDVGVVGINIEDSQPEEIYLKKLDGIRNYLIKTNQDLFINARTDAFLQKLPSPLETTIERAKRYQSIGANGLFVTSVSDPELIKKITSSTTLPVNVVGTPSISSVKALADCGVKRVSMAVWLYRTTYSFLEAISLKVKSEQSLNALFDTI